MIRHGYHYLVVIKEFFRCIRMTPGMDFELPPLPNSSNPNLRTARRINKSNEPLRLNRVLPKGNVNSGKYFLSSEFDQLNFFFLYASGILGKGETVFLRQSSRWNTVEFEAALVFSRSPKALLALWGYKTQRIP